MQNNIPIHDNQNTADLQKQLTNPMITNIKDLKNNVKDIRDMIKLLLKKTLELPNLMTSNPIVSQIKKEEIKLLQNKIDTISNNIDILLEKATNVSTSAADEFTNLSRIINNYIMDDIIISLKKNFEILHLWRFKTPIFYNNLYINYYKNYLILL